MRPRDESLLQDLLDDRLDAAEAAAARARLDAEPELAEAWEELRRIRDLVRGAPADRAPPDFLSRVRARIAAPEVPAAGAPSVPTGAGAPAGRLLTLPRRLAVAASGLAALFLVALGVRWIVARGAPPVLETHELESAEAPARSAPAGDLLRERTDGTSDARNGVRAAEPAAAPPAAPAPILGPRGRGFAPGDQVPPNLRRPTEEPIPREEERDDAETLARLEEVKRRAGRDKAADALRPEAVFTWSLEAEDVTTGRARLALLVGTLEAGAADGYGATPLRPHRDDDRILGSVLLCLSEAQVAALDPGTETARPGAPEDLDRDDEASGAGREARRGAKKDGKLAADACRVRVLLVRPGDGR